MSKPANTVLIISDEAQSRRLVVFGLELHGYVVHQANDAAAGLRAAIQLRPDLIVMDFSSSDEDFEVLETIRGWSNVPIFVTSIHSEEDTKVRLLKGGADDYVVKPFGIAELAARCEAALRRYQKVDDRSPLVRTGRLSVDLASRSVMLDGRTISLTRREYRLLHLLTKHLGMVVFHNQLIGGIWGNSSPNNIQYLRMLVCRLRQKLEDEPTKPKLLTSHSGIGYRLERIEPVAPAMTIEDARRLQAAPRLRRHRGR